MPTMRMPDPSSPICGAMAMNAAPWLKSSFWLHSGSAAAFSFSSSTNKMESARPRSSSKCNTRTGMDDMSVSELGKYSAMMAKPFIDSASSSARSFMS